MPEGNPPSQQLNALLQLFNAGRMQEVTRGCLVLLQSFPASAAVAKLLGMALRSQGRFGDALQVLDQVVRLAPDDFDAHLNRGIALQGLGRLEQAIGSYDRAIALAPDCADAYNNRGVALQALKQPALALASCDQAIRISPSSPMAHYSRGNALKGLGRFAQAAESYRQACRLRPDYLQAHLNLGHALQDMGRFDQARDSYRQALHLRPDHAEALFSLGMLTRFSAGDALLAHMESLVVDPSRGDNDRMLLRYALARAYEDLGDHTRSFDSLQAANNLHAGMSGYQIDGDRLLMRHIRQLFSAADLPSLGKGTTVPAARRPIFIVGMPRSGTSLVEQILASHPDVHGAGELGVLTDLVSPIMLARVDQGSWGRSPVSSAEISRLRQGYLHALEALGVREGVITDKMPLNFRWIGFIMAAFPEARIIHVRRDPIATCWSIYRQNFSGDSNPYAHRLTDLAGYYKLYLDLMSFWQARFPQAIHELSYEALTEQQEAQTAALLEYCGLAWDPRCLRFHETDRPVATASSMQVRKKMYRGSSQAWKAYEVHLRPLIDALAPGPGKPS